MPKLSGVFDTFIDLEKVPIDRVIAHLKFKLEAHILENFIANRIIYPQTIPTKLQEMEIDIAILRSYIEMFPSYFYDSQQQLMLIPKECLNRFGKLLPLITIFIESLNLSGVNQIAFGAKQSNDIAGSLIGVELPPSLNSVDILILGKSYRIKKGTISNIPYVGKKIPVKVDGLKEVLVSGGEAGVFFDLREKKK